MEIERWNGTNFLDGLKIDWDFLIGMFSLKFYSFIKTRKYYQDIRIVFTIQWIEIKLAEIKMRIVSRWEDSNSKI